MATNAGRVRRPGTGLPKSGLFGAQRALLPVHSNFHRHEDIRPLPEGPRGGPEGGDEAGPRGEHSLIYNYCFTFIFVLNFNLKNFFFWILI